MPKTGDRLSILGFGCMRLPVHTDGTIDEPRAIPQIRSGIDKGINYLDTAWPYHGGESERVLGLALQDGYREKVRIATKLPSWLITSREEMDHYLNAQLAKLGTDRIDYYLLHALDGTSWDNLVSLGVLEFLDTAKGDGRIVNAGFSFHGLLQDFKRIVDGYPWEFCQIQYNFLDREFQAGTEGLEYAAAGNLGVVIMEPLRGGNLGQADAPPAVAEIWETAETKRSPVEWALRFVWDRPEVTVVLSGMNDEAHIKENLAIADKAEPASLTQTECELIDKAAATYQKLMKVGCTGCGYCLPCPMNVRIPSAFEMLNKMHLFGNENEARFGYAVRMSGVLTGTAPAFASQCVQCGECLEKCPQNLDIPAFLAEAVRDLEGDGLEERVEAVRKMLKGKE
jgi:hypothetical protein